jgi:CRP-like cAMP-binding protein
MDVSDLPQFLHRLRFLSAFSFHDLQELTAGATLRTLSPGEVLFREGAENHDFFVVCRGRIRLDIQVPRRGVVPILTLTAGDMLGWSALLAGGRMEATATAVDDVQVAAFPADRLRTLVESRPEIGREFMRQLAHALARRLLSTRDYLKELLANT